MSAILFRFQYINHNAEDEVVTQKGSIHFVKVYIYEMSQPRPLTSSSFAHNIAA